MAQEKKAPGCDCPAIHSDFVGIVEKALKPLIPPAESNDFCHRMVDHGRAVCTARTAPRCEACCCAPWCAKRI